MADRAKKMGLFSKIETRADALKLTRDASIGFLFLAGLQGVLGAMIAPTMLIDAIILGLLGLILMKWCSRTAAVLLLLVSLGQTGVTVLNRMGVTSSGGKNVFLAVLMLIVAVRAVEATFKLQGRFATPAVRAPNRSPRVITGR
jgi:hypothetical protein